MPIQYFPTGNLPVSLTTDVGQLRLVKNISKPGRLETKTTTSVGKISRLRSLELESCNLNSSVSGALRRKLRLPVGTMASNFKVEVRFFLAVNPVAPPIVSMYRASVIAILNGSSAPAWSGSRLAKGDLIPVSFKVTGQKLAGLFAEFTATRKDDELAYPILKTGSVIHLTDPSIDERNKTEVMMGSFSIEPGDTESFPNREVELHYRLRLLDGIGRVYTVECGSFTVYNC